MNSSDQHAAALAIVHEEAGRTLSKHDFDLCMRIAKRALASDAAQAPSGYCVEGENHCVCGGDLPRVREGCGNWRKVAAPVAAATAAPSEHEKAMADAVIYGTGIMKDGQHVPLDQVRAQPDPFARMASGPELQERLARATCTCKGVLGHSRQCAMFDESMMRATAPQAKWECAASKQDSAGGNDPAECDWPVCGCDEKATEVIAALQECDLLKNRSTTGPIYQIGANAGGGIAWWDVDKDRYEREKKAGYMKTGIVYREAT